MSNQREIAISPGFLKSLGLISFEKPKLIHYQGEKEEGLKLLEP